MTGQGTGRLVLAATPLGNPRDASPRLAQAIADASTIAAEDTRRLRRLAADLGVAIKARTMSLHDSVEGDRARRIADILRGGGDVLVVTDAGMPGVSDPGYRVVRAAIEAGAQVSVLPGPSAALAALVVSGLPVDRFCFEGFLPRRAGERRRRLAELATDPRTLVIFEAPHRVPACLAALVEAFGADRPAALVRELTKPHEEVRRATLGALVESIGEGVRGEVTLVVGGAPAGAMSGDPDTWAREVAERVGAGADRRSAIGAVALAHGVARREVYDAVVRAKHAADRPGEGAP